MQQNKLLNGCYKKVCFIGQGASGKVCLYTIEPGSKPKPYQLLQYLNEEQGHIKEQKSSENDQQEKDYIVIKKFNYEHHHNQGANYDQLHELRFMKCLQHPNVMQLKDVFVRTKNYQQQEIPQLCISMDFAFDLDTVLHTPAFAKQLTLDDKIQLMRQILEGVAFLHSQFILHRDIKPQNLLLTRDARVVLADFGLARQVGSPLRELTQGVITINYRPPEIFFGSTLYGAPADMWSVGCTLVEIILESSRLFEAKGELELLQNIFAVRGTPTPQRMPGCHLLPAYTEFEDREPVPLTKMIPPERFPSEGVALIEQLLLLDPNKRLTAQQCLDAPFFKGCKALHETHLPQLAKQWNEQHLRDLIAKGSKKN